MNPRQLQQMAQQMQRQMQKIQEELAATEIEGSAGGGAITVKMNGHVSCRVSPLAAKSLTRRM